MTILLVLHLLAAIIWVGGMFFALVMVRPAGQELDLESRVRLWFGIMQRYMRVLWGVVVILPVTGYAMADNLFGRLGDAGLHVHIMQWLGWGMIGLFLFAYFAPFAKMGRMRRELLFPEAGLYMEKIRLIMILNLTLGFTVVIVAVLGKFW